MQRRSLRLIVLAAPVVVLTEQHAAGRPRTSPSATPDPSEPSAASRSLTPLGIPAGKQYNGDKGPASRV